MSEADAEERFVSARESSATPTEGAPGEGLASEMAPIRGLSTGTERRASRDLKYRPAPAAAEPGPVAAGEGSLQAPPGLVAVEVRPGPTRGGSSGGLSSLVRSMTQPIRRGATGLTRSHSTELPTISATNAVESGGSGSGDDSRPLSRAASWLAPAATERSACPASRWQDHHGAPQADAA